MSVNLRIIFFLAVLAYGLICIYRPVWVAIAIFSFINTRAGSVVYYASEKNQEIVETLKNNLHKYESKYPEQIARIKLIGFVAIFISIIGLCMVFYETSNIKQ